MDPVTTHAAIHVTFLTAETVSKETTAQLCAVQARGSVPLSVEDRFVIERAYALIREYCFYYAALMPSFSSGLVSFTARQALLLQIRTLYSELQAVQQANPELRAERWCDIETAFAPILKDWIMTLNTEAPHCAVAPLADSAT